MLRTQTAQERKEALRDDMREIVINACECTPDQQSDLYKAYMKAQCDVERINKEIDLLESQWNE